MPAWSRPGSQSVSKPLMRFQRTITSCRVSVKAWPMCSEPVTLGGGITMANGGLPRGGIGAEEAALLPEAVPARLDVLRARTPWGAWPAVPRLGSAAQVARCSLAVGLRRSISFLMSASARSGMTSQAISRITFSEIWADHALGDLRDHVHGDGDLRRCDGAAGAGFGLGRHQVPEGVRSRRLRRGPIRRGGRLGGVGRGHGRTPSSTVSASSTSVCSSS